MADVKGNRQRFGLLPDVPVGLSLTPETRKRSDGLERDAFISVLAGATIDTSDTITIGIYGDWGTGKTSVMGLMKDVVDADSGAVGVWFNAWQYEREEHLIVPLIATINKAIDDALGKFEERGKTAIQSVHKALRAVAYGFSFKGKVGIPLLAGAEFNLSGKDMVERYEKLSESYKELANEAVLDRSLYFDAFEKLRQASTGGPDTPKIVVFVDDLDRCLPKAAVNLLENIKLVMNLPNFSFVLGIAPEVIEAYVRAEHYKDLDMPKDYFRSYLDKFVQVPIVVPAPEPGVMGRHIEGLIDGEASFSAEESRQLKEVGNIISRISEGNPRNVVRTMNQVLVLYRVREQVRDASKKKPEEAEVPMVHLAFANELFKVRVALTGRSLRLRQADRKAPKRATAGRKGDEEGRLYVQEDWEATPEDILPFGEGMVWALEQHLPNPDDPQPTGFRDKLLALREVNSDAVVREALTYLSGRLPICCALKESEEGLKWLGNRGHIRLSFTLTETVRRKDEPDSSGLDDWDEIELLVLVEEHDPFSFDKVCDFVTDSEEQNGELPGFVQECATDLTKLGRRTHAESVNLLGCAHVTDLAPLQGLNSLQSLNLEGCTGVTDLAPLQGLTALRWINVSGCTGVTDLAPLQGLTALEMLFLLDCEGVTDLAPLQGLTALQWINVRGCTGVTDLAPLQGLTALKRLYLVGCTGVTDLAPLQGLTALELLFLGDCTGVTDLTPLGELTALHQIFLTGCTGISDKQVQRLREALPHAHIAGP